MLRNQIATPESLCERLVDDYCEETVSSHEAAALADWLKRRCQRFRGPTIRPNEIHLLPHGYDILAFGNSETNKPSGMGRH